MGHIIQISPFGQVFPRKCTILAISNQAKSLQQPKTTLLTGNVIFSTHSESSRHCNYDVYHLVGLTGKVAPAGDYGDNYLLCLRQLNNFLV